MDATAARSMPVVFRWKTAISACAMSRTPMREITLRQKLRYEFDKTLSRGTPALIAWLAILSMVLVILIAILATLLGVAPAADDGTKPGFIRLAWMSLMRTLDPGTMGGDEGGWPFLLLMLSVTLGGIFIVSTLIGVLTTGINEKIEQLRKGRSFVIENNHTLILGWSDHVFTIISELVQANENQKKPAIVILAQKDKVEMEDAVRDKVPDTKNTRVVCRTGSPIDLMDVEIANPHAARSIIILAPEGPDPDSEVIKTILAITNNPNRHPEPYHIVAEIQDPRNMEAARLVGGKEAQLIEVGDVISRVTVQTCRQSGLSVVYTELLDFGGDEIYFKEEAALVGKTFAEALFAYEQSTIMGLQYADGRVAINPPMDTRINSGDKLIAISEDDDTIKLSGMRPSVNTAAIRLTEPAPPNPEKTLLLGWNRRGPAIISELDNYVARGSVVTVVADVPEVKTDITNKCGSLRHQMCTFRSGDTTDRRTLDSLNVEQFHHIIVLCYSDHLDPQRADAKTLITLLHLRDMETRKNANFSIVSEMLDDRNRALAEVTQADDFIVSDKLISLMMAQVSENKYLSEVFTDLFDPEGSEIYLKPAVNYVEPGAAVTFYTVVEAARRRNEVAIGYRVTARANDSNDSYGVRVNPKKSEMITFAPDDKLILIAED